MNTKINLVLKMLTVFGTLPFYLSTGVASNLKASETLY